MLRKHKKSNIGIVKNQNQFMNTFVEAIVRTKAPGETVTIVADIPPGTVDLRTQVATFRNAKFDALGVFLLPGSHQGLLRALKDQNVRFQLFGVEEFLLPEHNEGFESVTNGVLVVAPAVSAPYKQKFEAKYGNSAGFYYTPAFCDFLVQLAEVVALHGDARGLGLVRKMHFIGKREGLSGTYSVKQSASGVYSYSFPIGIYRLDAGKVSIEDVIHY